MIMFYASFYRPLVFVQTKDANYHHCFPTHVQFLYSDVKIEQFQNQFTLSRIGIESEKEKVNKTKTDNCYRSSFCNNSICFCPIFFCS